jgi:hypothetical protein
MKNVLFLLSILFLFVNAGCEQYQVAPLTSILVKEQLDTMPLYSEEGKNVFAYRVNNKVVVNGSEFDTLPGIGRMYFKDNLTGNSIFYMEATSNRRRGYQKVILNIENLVDTGLYIAREPIEGNRNQLQYVVGENHLFNVAYVTTNEHIGYIHIKKLDTVNKIIAGTFNFKAKMFMVGDESDTVSITDGWFDIKYW